MNRKKKKGNLLKKCVVISFLLIISFISLLNGGQTAKAASDYRNWKQFEGEWADQIYITYSDKGKFGDHVGMENKSKGYGTIADWGCYLVSLSMQIAKSGTATDADFDPWDFTTHMNKGGYMSKDDDSLIQDDGSGVSKFTDGKFRKKDRQEVAGKSKDDIRDMLKQALDAGLYPIVRMELGGGGKHFVAIDKVEGDKIVMMDPGSSSDDLFDKYWGKIDQIRTYESDVPSNKANGTTTTEKVTEEEQEKIKIALKGWDEGSIAGMPPNRDWEEEPVPIVNYSELETHEKESIEKWKKEVEDAKNVNIVTINRVITMIFGIGLMLFSLVYLIAYVFDRITITEFRAMEALTRNRISVSSTGESTFFKGMNNYPKLINTRDLIMIEVLLIGLSVLIVNGGIYTVIKLILDSINYIIELFGIG